MDKVIIIVLILLTIKLGKRTIIRRNGEIRKTFSSTFIPILAILVLILFIIGDQGSGVVNIITTNELFQLSSSVGTLFIVLAGFSIMVGGFRWGSKSFMKWLLVAFALFMVIMYSLK